MASLVFIILLFIMYILYACIFFLYSKSVYQMTMSFITNDSRSGGKICSGDDSLAVESMATQVLCLILFHRWGSSEMLQNYQLLLLTFVGNANTHPKGEKKKLQDLVELLADFRHQITSQVTGHPMDGLLLGKISRELWFHHMPWAKEVCGCGRHSVASLEERMPSASSLFGLSRAWNELI